MRIVYWITYWWFVVVFYLLVFTWVEAAQTRKIPPAFTKLAKPVDIKFDQRTVAVADPNNHTITLVAGAGEDWVCAPHEGGSSCKPLGAVVAWLLAEGEK